MVLFVICRKKGVRLFCGKILIVLLSTVSAVEVKNDEFWDYDRQVDLEGFTTKQLYDTLARQSLTVTQAIGQHKDNVKLMYQRITNQNESLKGQEHV